MGKQRALGVRKVGDDSNVGEQSYSMCSRKGSATVYLVCTATRVPRGLVVDSIKDRRGGERRREPFGLGIHQRRQQRRR